MAIATLTPRRDESTARRTEPGRAPHSTHSAPAAERLRQALARALDAEGDQRLRRLSHANTSVTFEVSGSTPTKMTLLLDRNPPELHGGDQPAAITITLTPEQADRFAIGALSLPVTLASGRATWTGPVRSYLMVDAVIRSLLANAHG